MKGPKRKPTPGSEPPAADVPELPERWSATRKTEVVLRLLRGEALRHFGFLANRGRRAKLARGRALLGSSPSPAEAPIESVAALMLRLTGLDIERCPVCPQGRLRVTEILAPTSACTRRVPLVDTS